VELISRILSLQLAGNSSVIITDRTLVHRFHGLRDVKIINVQLVQGMSESGAVGDRMQPVDRAHRLARVSSLLGENSGGEELRLDVGGIAHDRLLQARHGTHVLRIGVDPEGLPGRQQRCKITADVATYHQLSRGPGALEFNLRGNDRERQT